MLSFFKFLIDQANNVVQAGLVFTMEFKEVYNDLENAETKELIERIEQAVSSTSVTCFS